ncbi:unnamed protein product [Musa hybrid cultivar]
MMQFCCTPLISLRRVAVVHKRVHVDCAKQEVIMKAGTMDKSSSQHL